MRIRFPAAIAGFLSLAAPVSAQQNGAGIITKESISQCFAALNSDQNPKHDEYGHAMKDLGDQYCTRGIVHDEKYGNLFYCSIIALPGKHYSMRTYNNNVFGSSASFPSVDEKEGRRLLELLPSLHENCSPPIAELHIPGYSRVTLNRGHGPVNG